MTHAFILPNFRKKPPISNTALDAQILLALCTFLIKTKIDLVFMLENLMILYSGRPVLTKFIILPNLRPPIRQFLF